MRQPVSNIIVLRRVEIAGQGGAVWADLLLDTGAAITILSKTTIETAGYDLSAASESQRIVTGSSVIEVPVIKVAELRVQELVVKDILVCVHNIPEVANIHGLLGMNFLKHFRTVVDFLAGYLEIS